MPVVRAASQVGGQAGGWKGSEVGPSGFWRRCGAVGADIKLSHTVFALPFALLATFLASGSRGRLPSTGELALILGCMFLARTAAMTFNRWADAGFDAANPRTSKRAIPRGDLSGRFMLLSALSSGAGFVMSTAGFWFLKGNIWPVVLSPLVLVWLMAYSYTKRYTWLCHLFLGVALALSPLAATVAVEPGYLAAGAPYLLVAMVGCWVSGFDVIYSLQDVEFDRRLGLFSMPASLGVGRALCVSRGLHLAAGGALVGLAATTPLLGAWFAVASVATIGLLIVEHGLVWVSGTKRIHTAFFTVNGVISVLLGCCGIVDVWRGV